MTTLHALWTIVLVATLVGAALSAGRIALGLHFWRSDTLRQAVRLHPHRPAHVPHPRPCAWAPARALVI